MRKITKIITLRQFVELLDAAAIIDDHDHENVWKILEINGWEVSCNRGYRAGEGWIPGEQVFTNAETQRNFRVIGAKTGDLDDDYLLDLIEQSTPISALELPSD